MSLTTLPIGPRKSPNNLRERWVSPTDRHSYAHVAFSPDGKNIARVYQGGADILDVNGRQITVVNWQGQEAHDKKWNISWYPYRIKYSPDGKTIAVSGTNASVCLLNSETLQEESLVSLPCGEESFAFSPRGNLLVVGHSRGITIVDLANNNTEEMLPSKRQERPYARNIIFSPPGDKILFNFYNPGSLSMSIKSYSGISLYDIEAKKNVCEKKLDFEFNSVICIPNKNLMALLGNRKVCTIDSVSLEIVNVSNLLPGEAVSMCSSKDGNKLYIGYDGKKFDKGAAGIFTLETDTCKVISNYYCEPEDVARQCQSVDCSPTADLLVADFDSHTRLFEV